jgi:hypothetical protein
VEECAYRPEKGYSVIVSTIGPVTGNEITDPETPPVCCCGQNGDRVEKLL